MCLIISSENSRCVAYTYSFPGGPAVAALSQCDAAVVCAAQRQRHTQLLINTEHLYQMQVHNLLWHNVGEKRCIILNTGSLAVDEAAVFVLKASEAKKCTPLWQRKDLGLKLVEQVPA